MLALAVCALKPILLNVLNKYCHGYVSIDMAVEVTKAIAPQTEQENVAFSKENTFLICFSFPVFVTNVYFSVFSITNKTYI
jgi:hypothetical protein